MGGRVRSDRPELELVVAQQLVQPGHGAARAVALHQLEQQRGLAAQQLAEPHLRVDPLQRLHYRLRGLPRRPEGLQRRQLQPPNTHLLLPVPITFRCTLKIISIQIYIVHICIYVSFITMNGKIVLIDIVLFPISKKYPCLMGYTLTP